mgnify:CR=1 FL=1
MSQFMFEISDNAFENIAFLIGLFFFSIIFLVLIPFLYWYLNRNPFGFDKWEKDFKGKEQKGNSNPKQPNQNSNN